MTPRTCAVGVVALTLLVPVSLVVPASASSPTSAAGRPTCHGLRATIVGTARRDRLEGTAGRDVIAGLGGDDRIDGRGGDDVLCGGDGGDRLVGGPGADRLYGGRAALVSDRGGVSLEANTLDGGRGNDLLDIGRDTRRTSSKDTAVTGYLVFGDAAGGVSVDLSTGRRGVATGAGRDRIVVRARLGIRGTARSDIIVGSDRAETIVAGAGSDTISGGGGDDRISPDAPLRRGPGNDDVVDAGPGDDTVQGDGGADTYRGGPGDDLLAQDAGLARLYGDEGDDTLFLVTGTRVGYVADGGAGDDNGGLAVNTSLTGLAQTVRMIEGTVSRDSTVVGRVAGLESTRLDDSGQWTYYGSDLPERVVGGFGYPFVAFTYGGDDRVQGTSVDDMIDAGDGTDTVRGELGTDTCLNAEVVKGCERLTP